VSLEIFGLYSAHFMNVFWHQIFLTFLQNASKTKCPDEIVRFIQLAIPPGLEDVYNPIKDASLMALIGAKRTNDIVNTGNKVIVGSEYEVQNATTGTTFKLWWWRMDSHHYCRIEKK